MRRSALAAVVAGLVFGAPLGALLVPSSDDPRAAATATFVRINSLTTVSNPNAPELTIDADAGKAVDNHCCTAGSWKAAYDWIVPGTLTTGEQADATLAIQVSDVDPEQELNFQISMLAPDTAEALAVRYPGQKSGRKEIKFPISAGYASSDELTITIRLYSAEVVYHYKRARTATLGETTKPVPDPGESVKASSPEPIPRRARREKTSVTNSSGNLENTTLVADANAGQAVAACWLIGLEAVRLPDGVIHSAHHVEAFAKLDEQIAEARKQQDRAKLNELITRRFLACVEYARLVSRIAPRSAVTAATGCQAIRHVVVVQRNRRGRATGLKVVRRAPGRRDVRYSCAVDGSGAITISADGRRRGGLRAELGRKLDFGVLRERDAEPDSGRLTFRFGV